MAHKWGLFFHEFISFVIEIRQNLRWDIAKKFKDSDFIRIIAKSLFVNLNLKSQHPANLLNNLFPRLWFLKKCHLSVRKRLEDICFWNCSSWCMEQRFFFPLKHYCYDVLNIIPGKSCISLGILFFFFFNRSMLGFWVRFVILVEKSWDQWNGLYTPAKTHFFRVWKSPCFGRCHSPRTERRLSSNDVMFYPQQKKVDMCDHLCSYIPAPLSLCMSTGILLNWLWPGYIFFNQEK